MLDTSLKGNEKEPNPNIAPSPDSSEDAQEEVTYVFGDAGSSWRMTKLKAIYRQAKETGKTIEDVAVERFGSLQLFDDAREEEIELDHRKMYGKGWVGKSKPTGELFQERALVDNTKHASTVNHEEVAQDEDDRTAAMPPAAVPLDQNSLNKLKAQLMRAKLKGDPEAASLEAKYNAAVQVSTQTASGGIALSKMENRQLAGGRQGEVRTIDNKRGRARGTVQENDDMSIDDMIRQERKTKGQNEALQLAERIGRDGNFKDGLEYLEDNAEKLAKSKAKTDAALRGVAVEDYKRVQRVLDSCPLCHHEEKADPIPTAPIVALGTRVYLTLPTEPEVGAQGACIVPIDHRKNLLECDDDEWEEIRNFMKCLMRMQHSLGRAVIFYENAASPGRRLHAAMMAVPIPLDLGDTAPAFFREAFLVSDEEWSQHKKVIDTLKAAKEKGLGRNAFRRSLVKESPYFHVWFTLDGGLGHVIENERMWPSGDLFAREVLGGMLNVEPQVYKKQGRWHKQDPRVKPFRAAWDEFDWTKVLIQPS